MPLSNKHYRFIYVLCLIHYPNFYYSPYTKFYQFFQTISLLIVPCITLRITNFIHFLELLLSVWTKSNKHYCFIHMSSVRSIIPILRTITLYITNYLLSSLLQVFFNFSNYYSPNSLTLNLGSLKLCKQV